jgi:hypothetical protein
MIIKLNIFNIENFLTKVNECSEAINLLYLNKKAKNINKQYGIQNELMKKHKKNNDFLQLSLDISSPKDYLDIVYFTIGDY